MEDTTNVDATMPEEGTTPAAPADGTATPAANDDGASAPVDETPTTE